jgi:aspartyl protease
MINRTLCHAWLALVFVAASYSLPAQDHSTAMELRHNMPFVQVMVNGKGPFTFSIDTGTGGEALVTPGLIQQLKLPESGKAEIGDPTGRNKKEVSVVKIQTLEVAGIAFKDVQAAQFEPSQREGQVDGILGFPLFAKYLLTLDYPKQQLRLDIGTLRPDDGQTVIPFTMPDNVPIVPLKFGSQQIDAHVDSRGVGLNVPEKFASSLKFTAEPIVIGRGRTVSNQFEIKGAELDGTIQLGSYVFPHPFLTMDPVLPLANFGAIALRNFAITFDQQNKLMRLEAAERTIVISAPHRPTTAAPAASSAPSTTNAH